MRGASFVLHGLAVLLTIAVYVGSYLALVYPLPISGTNFGGSTTHQFPYYRFGYPISEIVFRPALWVDERLRPTVWEPTFEPWWSLPIDESETLPAIDSDVDPM